MDIKILNTEKAKNDALVILSGADSFTSLVNTMMTIKKSIEDNWSDSGQARESAISKLTKCIDYYNNYIIPALDKLGTAIEAYAIATEKLSSTVSNNATSTVGIIRLSEANAPYTSPTQYVEAKKLMQKTSVPDFSNKEIWLNNRYAISGFIGECTWFAHGRIEEMYGIDPGFSGDGQECVKQLVTAHPDMFYHSDVPVDGALFSSEKNKDGHTGIILAVEGNNITYQEGNIYGNGNNFENAKNDWRTRTVTIDEFKQEMGSNVSFANPKENVEINW